MTRFDTHSVTICRTHSTGLAIHTVANPDEFAHSPELIRAAWLQLKLERGQPVDTARIGPAAYLINPKAESAPAPTDPAPVHIGMSPEALTRLRRRASIMGWLRGNDGGDAA